MMFLHQHHIPHRDLKPENILLDSDFRPHIIDFGLSKFYEKNKSQKVIKYWRTTIYMSHESIESNQYSEKTDFYSFGILMFEVVTDQIPYPLYERRKMTDFVSMLIIFGISSF